MRNKALLFEKAVLACGVLCESTTNAGKQTALMVGFNLNAYNRCQAMPGR